MKSDINWEFLREMLAIVDGVPAKQFSLNHVVYKITKKAEINLNDENLQCCALGWVLLYPNNKIKNIKWDYINRMPTINSSWVDYYDLAEKFFNFTSDEDIQNLFGSCKIFEYNTNTKTHKEIFKNRVRKFFIEHNQPLNPKY